MSLCRRKPVLTVAAVLATCTPIAAHSAAFYIIESSGSGMGRAFAGSGAVARDASTAYFNPAAITRFEESRASLAGHYIVPYAEFENDGSTVAPTGRALAGDNSESEEPALVPNLYYATPLDDSVSFSISVNAPFGLDSSYESGWYGRYHALDSSLRSINLNPSVAYEVTDRLSLAWGVNIQRVDAELSNAVDSAAACRSAGDTAASCAAKHGGFANPDADSKLTIEGDDTAFAFNLGALYEFGGGSRIGFTWRQGYEHTVKGSADFDRSASCEADAFCRGATADADVNASIELPTIVNLSGFTPLTDRLDLLADVTWYEWSVLEAVPIVRQSDGREISRLELDYEDTLRYNLGARYRWNNQLTLRSGVAYDEAPQTDPKFVTPRIPDGNRTWISLGATYAWSDSFDLDVGYSHLFIEEVEINNTEQAATLKGNFDPTVDIFSVQANWRY